MLGRNYNLGEVAQIIGAEILGVKPDSNLVMDRVVTDSRYSGINANSLFFALKTERNDGHKYIGEAYEKGVRVFVVLDDYQIDHSLSDSCFLKTKDVLQSLQDFAKFHRDQLSYPIVAITGSNGKTIVKEWLYQLLSPEKKIVRSPKSYNSQIGVPISLLELPISADFGIIEAGISKPGEMEKLANIINPDQVIITNIHDAHRENFDSEEELVSEKIKLAKNSKQVFFRSDYHTLNKKLEDHSDKQFISWSSDSKTADYFVKIDRSNSESYIYVSKGNKEAEFKLPFSDLASVENAIHALIFSMENGVKSDILKEKVTRLSPVAMRLQQLKGVNQCTLINDSYNSDLTSLEIALHFLNMQNQHEKKTLIISDIYQSGLPVNELYERVAKMCSENGIDRVFGIGKEIAVHASKFGKDSSFFYSTNDFLTQINTDDFWNEGILIKGSRSFEFERVSRRFEFRMHETHLDVNLTALIDNLNYYKSIIDKDVKIMVMVKAFSYGTGSFEIANVLQHQNVDYLAVAYIDEGVELRRKGINTPIVVMNPSLGDIDLMLEYSLEPEIYSLSSLEKINKRSTFLKRSFKIHLKVESGMHRLGFEMDDISKVAETIANSQYLEVSSVFSHLVASDNPDFDETSKEQSKVFVSFCSELEKRGVRGFSRHLLNSDGIVRMPQCHFEMVRLGIGLYGLTNIPENRDRLRSVVTLKTRISQLKTLKKGDKLGYNHSFTAQIPTQIATIPIGYADGLSRDLGNGKWNCRINDRPAPIIGNVCMDMCMLDVTDIEGLNEGDEVIVISGNKDVYEMARMKGTIPYEIMTSISERVRRQFFYGE